MGRLASIGSWPTGLPLILDVDTGIDDSLALLYAGASPEAEFIAVTCVSGNVDAQQVAINTRAVLELAGRTDVEVALGREVPLVRELETTPETHGPQASATPSCRRRRDRCHDATPRPHRGRGTAAPGRADAGDPRAADQPRARADASRRCPGSWATR